MSPACVENETEDGWLMVDAPPVPPFNAPEEKWVVTATGDQCRDKYVACQGDAAQEDDKENDEAESEAARQDDDCRSAVCGSEASHGTRSTTDSGGKIKNKKEVKKPVVNKKQREKNERKNAKKKKRLAPFCGRALYP